ncbi:MAG: tetratricopeptide repeat protein [Myxococcota bacterium]
MSNKAKIVNNAQKFLQKGAYDKAIRELQKLLEEDPKDVRTLLKVGDIYAKKEDRVEAIKYYRRVAEAYSEQGFFLKAVAVYKQILKHDPQHFEVTVKLAELYEHLGLLQEALGQYQMVASLHDQKGNTKEWLTVLKRMVELDPENVASRVRYAEGLSRENRVAEAVEEFTQASTILKQQGRQSDYVKVAERLVYLAPERTDVTMELARIYLALGDARRALSKLEPCYRSDPHNLQTLVLLGRAFREAGLDAKAVFIFKELAALHAGAGRSADAKLAWQTILEIDANDHEARAALGIAPGAPVPVAIPSAPIREVKTSTPQGAALGRMPLNQVVALSPPSAAGAVDVVPARLDLGSIAVPAPAAPAPSLPSAPPPAQRPTERPSMTPKKGKTKEHIAKLLTETDVYVKYGLRDKAIEHLKKIVDLDPESVEAYEKLRDLYLGAKDSARAADALGFMVRALLRRGDNAEAEAARAQLTAIAPQHPMATAGAGADIDFEEDQVADPAIDSIDIDVSTGDFDEDIADLGMAAVPAATHSVEIELQPITGSADIADLDILASIPAPPAQKSSPFEAAGADLPDNYEHPSFEEDSGFEGVGTDVDAARTAGLARAPSSNANPAPVPSAPFALADLDLVPSEPAITSNLSAVDASSLFDKLTPMPVPEEVSSGGGRRITADLITDLPQGGSVPAEAGAVPLLDEPFVYDSLAPPPGAAADLMPAESADVSDGDAELLSLLEGDDALPDPSETADESSNPELDEDLDNVEFLLEQGLYEEAREAVLEVLRRRPLYPRAITALDKAEIALGLRPGEAAEAAADLDAALPMAEGDADPMAVIGLDEAPQDEPMDMGVGDDDPTMAQLDSGFETARPDGPSGPGGEDPVAIIERAYALREAGLLAEAVQAFEAASTSPPLAAEALEMAGHCQAALSDSLGAVTYFYRALEAGAAPDRAPRLKYEIGMACEASGDTDNALAWYTAAYAEDPEQPHLRTRIQNLGADPEALLEQQIAAYAEPQNGANGHLDEPPPELPPQSPRKNKISYI